MGIFSDFRAIAEVQKLKAGKRANLSIAQIVVVITNMSDAGKNLSKEQFAEVYALYSEYRKYKTKLNISMDDYVNIAIKIIKSFDAIAPYEKYSGGNASEFSLMMKELRDDITQDNIKEELLGLVDMSGDSNNGYIDYLVENGNGLTREQAKCFVGITLTFERYGRDEALKRFKLYAEYLMSTADKKCAFDIDVNWSISFLCGLLAANEIVTKEESDSLSNHYFHALHAHHRNEKKSTDMYLPNDA